MWARRVEVAAKKAWGNLLCVSLHDTVSHLWININLVDWAGIFFKEVL